VQIDEEGAGVCIEMLVHGLVGREEDEGYDRYSPFRSSTSLLPLPTHLSLQQVEAHGHLSQGTVMRRERTIVGEEYAMGIEG